MMEARCRTLEVLAPKESKRSKNYQAIKSRQECVAQHLISTMLVLMYLSAVFPHAKAEKLCGADLINVLRYICRTTGVQNSKINGENLSENDLFATDCCRIGCSYEDLKSYCLPNNEISVEASRRKPSHHHNGHAWDIRSASPIRSLPIIPIVPHSLRLLDSGSAFPSNPTDDSASNPSLLQQIMHHSVERTYNDATPPSIGYENDMLDSSRTSNQLLLGNPRGSFLKEHHKNSRLRRFHKIRNLAVKRRRQSS